MKKIYPAVFAETEDQRIVQMVTFLILKRQEMERNGEVTNEHNIRVRQLSSFIRRCMGETRLLSLALNNSGNKVGIYVYDKEATEEYIFFQTHYDEDRNMPYIVEDEGVLLHV